MNSKDTVNTNLSRNIVFGTQLLQEYKDKKQEVDLTKLDFTKVLILGDTHFDDYNPIRYKDYWENCVDVMERIKKLKKLTKATMVIFAGDLLGLRQSTKMASYKVLDTLIQFFKEIGPVISLKGNHDFAEHSAFDFMVKQGYILSVTQVGNQIDLPAGKTRLHLVDYGNENYEVDLGDSSTFNTILCHNQVDLTQSEHHRGQGLFLPEHYNWKEVNLILCGHIHEPSDWSKPELLENTLGTVRRVYLGCPTRTSRRDYYNSVNYVIFDSSTMSMKIDAGVMNLELYDNVFIPTENTLSEEAVETLGLSKDYKEELANLYDLISANQIVYGGVEDFIEKIPSVPSHIKQGALKYIEKAKKVIG